MSARTHSLVGRPLDGRFSTHEGLPGPDAKSTTRLRLECPEHGLVAMLSAMTVDLIGDEDAYHVHRAKLGQDPLREDADPDALWNRFRTVRKSVGLVWNTVAPHRTALRARFAPSPRRTFRSLHTMPSRLTLSRPSAFTRASHRRSCIHRVPHDRTVTK